ncbi:MAG: sugar phosphate isomerase/epimerase [Acidobacteria bacterium]|nr:sugar phosphate isomerase/epimerase [Acidobacteriota bacterium]MDA1236667.1 sugar phosphate isomerase/epimerase [Acidobacteriota bacterium]
MKRRELLKMVPAAAGASLIPSARADAPKSTGGSARIKSALCAYSYREQLQSGKMSYEDLVDIAVEHGIDGLDLTVYWLPKTGMDAHLMSLRRKAYLAAVEIPAIAIRSNLCRSTDQQQQMEVAWLSHWVDVADKLGASHIRIFGGTVPDGATDDQAAGWVVEILKRAAEYAGKKGVILGIENHGGITLYGERVVSIVNAVDSPWVGINLDTGNFRRDPYREIEMCVPHAVNAQFKTMMNFEDGRHEASDWDRVMKMFAASGYKGYVSLEYEGEEPVATAVPKYLAQLRDLSKKYST